MKLTATSKSGMYKQLEQMYKDAHSNGNDYMADKLYALSEDVMFDKYLSTQNIRARFAKIVG